MNTGHDGGWATVHANAAGDVPARLIALGALADLPPQAVAVQALSAIDAIVHLRRVPGRRELAEVAVLAGDDDGVGGMTSDLALSLGSDGDLQPAGAWDRLAARLDAGTWDGRG